MSIEIGTGSNSIQQILQNTNEISEKLDKLQTSMSINTIITETYEECDDEE